MDKDQFALFLKDNRESTAKAIQETVNGKIDNMRKEINDHNKKHEDDMKRLMPVLESYESTQRHLADARAGGKTILWIAGFITAVGSAYLIIINIFTTK